MPGEERRFSQWGHLYWPPLAEPPIRRRLGAYESSPAPAPAAPPAPLAPMPPVALALAALPTDNWALAAKLLASLVVLLLLLPVRVLTVSRGARRPAEAPAAESCAAACCAARWAARATAAKSTGLGAAALLGFLCGTCLGYDSADWATTLLAAACAAACDAAMAAAVAAADVDICCTAATDAVAGERPRFRFMPSCSYI